MKIAILLDSFGIGGTELNAVRTLEAMARRGVDVEVLHFHADGPLFDRVAASGHRLTHVPIVPLSSPRIVLRTAALAAALRGAGVTVVHAQDVYTNIVGVAAARYLARIPIITSRRWKDEVPRRELTPLNAWAHRRSSLVAPNSDALIPTLLGEGVKQSRIALHENFVDDSAFCMLPAGELEEWRRRLGVPSDAMVVGCVARFTRVKRHDTLIEAFALVRTRIPHAFLLLVGDGAERTALSEQARALGLESRVAFTGMLPNTPLPQQLFDVAVLVSENEGFPNALVEAALCGVPLVATMVGGVPSVLRDGITGLSVQTGNVKEIATAIEKLLREPKLAGLMGAAASELVRANFSESAAVDRLLEIYRRVSA